MEDNLFKPPIILPGKASQRRFRAPLPTKSSEEENVIKKGRDYVNAFTQHEQKLYEEQSKKTVKNDKPEYSSLSNVDSFTNVTSLNDNATDLQDGSHSIYDRFPKKGPKYNESLPIFKDREDILKKVRTNKVMIIKGHTGCGKTTQVPQYILDDALAKQEPCNIVVTQPRRIAAINVARRVCEERNCELGTLVGYQIGLDRKHSEDTRILYCTTGVLLEKLIAAKKLTPYTHIILDEVHERDQDMDFLLLVARRLVNTNSRDVKVILMSATFDTAIFSEYFYTISNNQKIFPPTQSTNEKSMYKIRTYTTDDFKDKIPEATGMCFEKDNPGINKKGYQTAVRLIEAFDNLDRVENREKSSNKLGSVLVFLPGMHEIEEMHKTIEEMTNNSRGWKIYPLHSMITYEEQKAAFRPPAEGERKIILSTNITESSVTVTDMKYVIDFCLTKSLVREQLMNFSMLKVEWASKNSLEQRAGRVGRVSDGRVYRLITKSFLSQLEQEPEPEIRRCPLDQLVLKAKLLDMGEPQAILALALDQPDLENIEKTICQLKLIGALEITAKGELTTFDGDLTYLGYVIAKLPMESHLGKLIFLGHLFGIPEECVIMACSMATKPMFSNPFQQYLQAYNSKLAWADSSCSDCIAFCNAYKLWRKKSIEGHFRNSSKNMEMKWGRDRFVEIRTLREIATLEADIKYRLKSCGLVSKDVKEDVAHEKPTLNPAEKALFLKLAIAGAFYPNYFLRGSSGGQVDEKEAVKVLNGHNPYTTVYLQGMPSNQPRLLYKKSFQRKFEAVTRNANVIFDSCTKVYVDFGETTESQRRDNMCSTIPGKVDMAVYRAIKMARQPEFRFNLRVLNPEDAQKRYNELIERRKEACDAKQRGIGENANDVEWPWNKHVSCERKFTQNLCIMITQFQSPFRFWAQSACGGMKQKLQTLIDGMNCDTNVKRLTSRPVIDKLYAGRYAADKQFYRCRVVSTAGNSSDTYKVFFVDYGNYQNDVPVEDLREFEDEFAAASGVETLPYFAVEFRLAKVKSIESIVRSHMKEQANKIFQDKYAPHYLYKECFAEVWSVVNDIVHVKLSIPSGIKHSSGETLNDLLVAVKLAEKTDESYLSTRDHIDRKKWYEKTNAYNGDDGKPMAATRSELDAAELLDDIDSPMPNECTQEIFLKGPYSPLEMKIFGCTQCSVAKTVRIEQTSVNSVLLDTNPTDSHERMLVSAFVGTNENGDRLILRHTTVMPNLPGLPALVILMFSPMVELRTNKYNTKLSGALCGLGYDTETGAPLYEDQDIELLFDVEITLDHVTTINKIRYWLNRAACQRINTDESSKEIQNAARKLPVYLDGLFSTRFELQELCYCSTPHRWGKVPKENLLNPMGRGATADVENLRQGVFPLIWGIRLDGREHEEEFRVKVIQNIDRLREFSRMQLMTTTGYSIMCLLCQVELSNPVSTKLHLKSYQHKVRAARFDVPHESKTVSTASSMMSLNELYSPLNAASSSTMNYITGFRPHPNRHPKSLPLNCFADSSHMTSRK